MTYHPICADVGGWLFPCVMLALGAVLWLSANWWERRCKAREAEIEAELQALGEVAENVSAYTQGVDWHAEPGDPDAEYTTYTFCGPGSALIGELLAMRAAGYENGAALLYGELCERYGQSAVDAAIARAEGKE